MWPILRAVTRFFDVVLSPFAAMPPAVGLLVVSIVTGVVMLLIFGKTSNQAMITATKDKLKAYIMEMWIFRNDTRVMFSAIGSVIRNNLAYLRHSLRPLVFIFVPVLLIMIQLGIRYANEPLAPGDVAVVTARLRGDVRASESGVELAVPEGVSAVSAPLRIDATGEILWQIRAEDSGVHELRLSAPEGDVSKRLVVGEGTGVVALASTKAPAGSWDAFLYPSEPPVPRGSSIRSVSVEYPVREGVLFGLDVHWLLTFFVVSVAAGFALKGVFGIDV